MSRFAGTPWYEHARETLRRTPLGSSRAERIKGHREADKRAPGGRKDRPRNHGALARAAQAAD
jgi:hypothetical protein